MTPTEARIKAAAMRLFTSRGGPDVTMSELAEEAQVARGTLYRNIESVEKLYCSLIDNITTEIHAGIAATLDDTGADDPALRLATGIRLFTRLPHDNPPLGRFVVRFGLTEESLHAVLAGPPMHDIDTGIATGRYTVPATMALSIASLVVGSTVSAMGLVLEGRQTWRDAGSIIAELILRALDIAPDEAQRIATAPLPRFAANAG